MSEGLESVDILLWDDNPAEVDLLGFDAVVTPVLAALAKPDLDPLTIGVHARWGGGKSTVLNLIGQALKDQEDVTVVTTNPWTYDEDADVKGALIAEILGALEERFKDEADLGTKVESLLKRISWARVAGVLAKGALAQNVDLNELEKALTPKKRTAADSMTGFRGAFDEFISSLPGVNRVVVLVDDLDRCLPPAVMATLEAIKLFLSVRRMVFVIAADQDMVKDAIAMNLADSPRGDRFAQRYLDKIVQLPVSLPHLPGPEAEAYITLLLVQGEATPEQYEALLKHCRARRLAGDAPLMADLDKLEFKPAEEVLRLAAQLTRGLRADKVTNPREIKRFLNAFSVRRQIASTRGLEIRPDVMAKLFLLEDRYRTDFELLTGLSEVDRPTFVEAWESWAKSEGDQPDGVSEESQEWAASDPSLKDEPIGPYLTLAAALAVVSTAPIPDELAGFVARLIGPSKADRKAALAELSARSLADNRAVAQNLLAGARVDSDVAAVVEASVAIVGNQPDLAEEISNGIYENCWQQLDAGSAVDIASADHPALKALAKKLTQDTSIDSSVRQAAKEVLEGNS